jgi:DNA-binding transcriptional regulator YiaG
MRSKPTRHGYHGNTPRIRVVSAFRFRDVRFSCGLSIPAAAKVLHVSERTLHNWESGAVRIPYAAFKLLRLLRGGELPGPAWKGWRLTQDTLYSPEGHGFKASDHAWWSLLVRRAAMFGELVARCEAARSECEQLRQAGAAPLPAHALRALTDSALLSHFWDFSAAFATAAGGDSARSDAAVGPVSGGAFLSHSPDSGSGQGNAGHGEAVPGPLPSDAGASRRQRSGRAASKANAGVGSACRTAAGSELTREGALP